MSAVSSRLRGPARLTPLSAHNFNNSFSTAMATNASAGTTVNDGGVKTAGIKRKLPESYRIAQPGLDASNGKGAPGVSAQNQARKHPLLQIPEHYATYYTWRANEVPELIAKLEGESFGLDVEWKVHYRKNVPTRKVALMQICDSKTILLLHIFYMKPMPTELINFLSAPHLIKTGLNIRLDGLKLHRDYGLKCGGLLELRGIAAQVDARWTSGRSGTLANLCEDILTATLDKSAPERTGDWERIPLLPSQKSYAAIDAFASFRVLQKMMDMPLLKVTPVQEPTGAASDTVTAPLPRPELRPFSVNDVLAEMERAREEKAKADAERAKRVAATRPSGDKSAIEYGDEDSTSTESSDQLESLRERTSNASASPKRSRSRSPIWRPPSTEIPAQRYHSAASNVTQDFSSLRELMYGMPQDLTEQF